MRVIESLGADTLLLCTSTTINRKPVMNSSAAFPRSGPDPNLCSGDFVWPPNAACNVALLKTWGRTALRSRTAAVSLDNKSEQHAHRDTELEILTPPAKSLGRPLSISGTSSRRPLAASCGFPTASGYNGLLLRPTAFMPLTNVRQKDYACAQHRFAPRPWHRPAAASHQAHLLDFDANLREDLEVEIDGKLRARRNSPSPTELLEQIP